MAERKNPVVIEDPRAIRALAHPARLEAIDRLYAGEVLTATALAESAELSASAMSYHLRELAKWGVIERVTDGGDGRERRWRAAGDTLQIGSGHKSTGLSSAEMTLIGHVLDRLRSNIDDFVARGKEETEPWKDALRLSSHDLLLTGAELTALQDELSGVLDRYDAKRRAAPEGARRVRFTTAAVPLGRP
jgi:DNA-binding transcriptional ArsR family regulator